jgi:nucleotide-binding universal stress UspA family protein
MNTILVPTDYSKSADDALEYAIGLAKLIQGRIILYHAFHIHPPPVDYFPGTYSPMPEIGQIEQTRLEVYAKGYEIGSGSGIEFHAITSVGFAVDEIPDYAAIFSADFIVMGVPHSGRLGHELFGSVTTGVIERVKRPLILVPENTKFVVPERIAYACDLEQKICSEVVGQVKEFIRLFNAELFVINVENPGDEISNRKAFASLELESELQGVTHSLHFPSNKDVVSGLVEFEGSHGVDMLVMVPKKHSIVQQLLHVSKTRKMVFNTPIPVLVLHE